MIQRIQSVYLFLVLVLMVLLAFFPIASFQGAHNTIFFHIDELKASNFQVFPNENISNKNLSEILNFVPLALATALTATSLVSLFSFRDRSRQLKLNAIALFINMALVLVILYYTDIVSNHPDVYPKVNYEAGAFFPVASILLLILANRGIRADIKKIKSADRIR